MSFRLRLALGGLAVAAAVLTLFVVGVDSLLGAAATSDRDNRLERLADDSIKALRRTPADDLASGIAATALPFSDLQGPFAAVFDPEGNLLSATARDAAAVGQLLASAGGPRAPAASQIVTIAGEELRIEVHRWQHAGIPGTGALIVGEPTRLAQAERAGGRWFLIIAGVVALLAAAFATWFVSGRAMRPLKELATMATEIGETGDLRRRIPARNRQDVLGTLATSFNGMLDRLAASRKQTEDALEEQRRFTADASHELRTPLTTIRSNAGLLLEHDDVSEHDRRNALADIAAEGERMGRMVNGLLSLARGDAGVTSETWEDIDVRDVVEEAVASMERSGREVRTALEGDVLVRGDRDLLFSAIRILLDNAASHGHGQNVTVRVMGRGLNAVIAVEDEGPGIPPASLDRVFERFYRADPARSVGGTGLGLAIARSAVEAHGGTIQAANRAEGPGAVFTIELPRVS